MDASGRHRKQQSTRRMPSGCLLHRPWSANTLAAEFADAACRNVCCLKAVSLACPASSRVHTVGMHACSTQALAAACMRKFICMRVCSPIECKYHAQQEAITQTMTQPRLMMLLASAAAAGVGPFCRSAGLLELLIMNRKNIIHDDDVAAATRLKLRRSKAA